LAPAEYDAVRPSPHLQGLKASSSTMDGQPAELWRILMKGENFHRFFTAGKQKNPPHVEGDFLFNFRGYRPFIK
jgi:hypothetical protein